MDDPKAVLLFSLDHFNIDVRSQNGKMVFLEKGYIIEVEGERLYKLLQDNQVIAPFDDVEELCNFIKMDMQLNEEN